MRALPVTLNRKHSYLHIKLRLLQLSPNTNYTQRLLDVLLKIQGMNNHVYYATDLCLVF